jgi:AAA+ ATPase superfamily predicted ATPase
MSKFVGRKEEIKKILDLKSKDNASLIVVMGRRRIGKSTLIDHVGARFKNYLVLSGLAPRKDMTNSDQLRSFHHQLQAHFKKISIPAFYDWHMAMKTLAQLTKKGEWLILLDEISWMGSLDPDFSGQLKVAWDQFFKKNDQLMMVVCGSVSSWIDENILNNADFTGRISLQLTIEELQLPYCHEFWGQKTKNISSLEKLKILSITGGVPKYLQEIITHQSAEKNILRLCFRPEGPLFHEFDKIFNEIFLKRNKVYNQLVRKISEKKMTASELAKSVKLDLNGDFSKLLRNLEISGFIKKDYLYDLRGKKQGLVRYRLKDNYLRFYFKYIEPNKDRIESKNFKFESVYQFSEWESTVGLQFENLILQNLSQLYPMLDISNAEVLAASPYYQRKTARTKGACQIDLLITTSAKIIYLCEFKVRDRIESNLIQEIQRKIKTLRIPRGYSLRPVLIYEGTMSEKTKYDLKNYFHYMIPFENFLTDSSV